MKFRVKEDCFCSHYMHEITNYPRPGLKELKLKKGDEVEYIDTYTNFYGSYIRVTNGEDEMDILPQYLEEIK